MQKIAFASIDGSEVDQHFGSARYFQIYERQGDGFVHAQTRKAAPACKGGCEGGFASQMAALHDCDAVFVQKIGQGAAAFMLQQGKRVFEASGEIEEILLQLTEGGY